MLQSDTRTVPLDETPWDSSATRTSPMSLSVLETFIDDLSEQLRANALSGIAPKPLRTQRSDSCSELSTRSDIS